MTDSCNKRKESPQKESKEKLWKIRTPNNDVAYDKEICKDSRIFYGTWLI
jgi:hypothetical protein